MIAVHTLAAASLQVLADLGKKAGFVSIVKNPVSIREDKRKLVFDRINAAQNFFKHADRDPKSILNFYPDATPFYILDAVILSEKLHGYRSSEIGVFHTWFILNYPDTLSDGSLRGYVEELTSSEPTLREKAVALDFILAHETHTQKIR